MKKLNCSLFLICSVVFGLATSSAAAFEPTAFITDNCGNASPGSPDSVDIESLAAVSDGAEIIVTMVLCVTPTSRAQYRVHLDYIAPFASVNGDCITTSDDTPKRAFRPRGMKDTGPGMITQDGATLTYVLTYAELGLSSGENVEIWADTQQRGIADRAPNTDDSDFCSKPQDADEVLQITLAS